MMFGMQELLLVVFTGLLSLPQIVTGNGLGLLLKLLIQSTFILGI